MSDELDLTTLNDEELLRLSLKCILRIHNIKTNLAYFAMFNENALTEELEELKAKAKKFEIELVKRSLAIT